MHHKNSTGSYDIFHYETSADVVLYTNSSDTSIKNVSGALDTLFTGKSNSNHTHGNITNAGAIGSTSGYAVYTTTSGKLTAGNLSVSDPPTSGTDTAFINAISQDAKGKITPTKASLPTANSSVAGIAKLGASGGAATYEHNHDTAYAAKSHNHAGGDITSGIVAADKLGTMTGASGTTAGASGAVTKPVAGDNTKFLRGDATWAVPSGTYEHPETLTAALSSKLYKVAVNKGGHITSATAVAKSDITALGIPAQDTTYVPFIKSGSTAAAGLVPSPGTTEGTTKYLREDASWQVPPNTNTKVTSAANHYAPAEDSDSTITINASGATAAWSIDVVKGITLKRDSKGHVVDMTVTSGKLPANPNTNTTYTIATGDSNGQIKVTPSSGTAYNVDVKGLASGAYAAKYTHPTTTAAAAAAVKVGNDASGHVVLGAALTASDVGAAASSHTHGNVTNAGAITATAVAIANGDSFAIVDSSASGKLVKSSITFDGSTTTKALSQKGTWVDFASSTHNHDSAYAAKSHTHTFGTTSVIKTVTFTANTVPSLTYTARTVGSASGWSAGTAAKATISEGVLSIVDGTAPSLTVTSVACDDITAWSAGTAASLSKTTADAFTSFTS